MFKRNWGVFAAFTGLALCQAAYGQDKAASADQATGQQSEVADPEAESVAVREAITEAAVKIEGALRDPVTENGQTHSQRDLEAQEEMAFWALVMALAAVVTTGVSIYVAAIVKKTLEATAKAADHAKTMADEAKNATQAAIAAAEAGQEANKIARAGVDSQLRAWITVKITDVIGFRMVNEQPHFHIRYVVKNIGKTPALDVSFFASMAFGENPRAHLDETIKHFRSAKIAWQDAILFPGDELERRSSCENSGETPPSVVKIGFYTVAKYKTALSKRLRFTAHLFDVIDTRRDDGLIDLDSPPFGDKLVLRANSDYPGYAT